jgi:hypothetical protein
MGLVTPFLSRGCPYGEALGYAASYWYRHAAKIPSEVTSVAEDLWKALRFFFWEVDASHRLVKGLHTSAAFLRWVDARDDEYGGNLRGCQPLHIAAVYGLVDILKYACAHPEGLDFNPQSTGGETPLLWAALEGHKAAVEILLGHGVDINLVDEGSNTPLILALYHGHEEVAQLILREDGVDVDHVDMVGKSALDHAYKKGLHGTVELLKAKGATVCRDENRPYIFPDDST